MAVDFDAISAATVVQTGVASGTNDTATITVGATATIAVAFVEGSLQGGNSDASITWPTMTLGGVAMTAVPSSTDHSGGGTSGFCTLFYLLNPPTGSQTFSVTMNHSGSPASVGNYLAFVCTYTGAVDASPLGTAKTNHAGGSSGSVTDTLASGDRMVACAVNGTSAPTVSTGTSRGTVNGDTSTASHAGIRVADNSGTGSVSVTFGLNAADSSGISGVKLIAATTTASFSLDRNKLEPPGNRGPGSSWAKPIGSYATAAGPATTNQTLSVTQTQTPSIATVTSYLRTLTATETQTPTIVRQTSKTLTVTETQSPTLTASRAYLRTLTATETQTPTIATPVTRVQTLSVTETQTPTMTRVTSHLLTLTATQTQSPTVTRITAHLLTLTVTETQTPTVTRQTSKTLTVTETQTASMVASRAFLRTLSVTQTQTATITATFQAGAVVAVVTIPELQHTLNRLAATLALSLDAQGAANVWAGTTNLDLVHALNRKAGTSGLELNGVAKLLALQLSGDPSLDAQGALASIPSPGGAFSLMEAAPMSRRRRLLTTAVRHKKTVAVGSVGVVGTATALLKGILL